MKDCIIFCQAPYDVQQVLNLYDRNKDTKRVIIIVVNVVNNYKFIKSLCLSAKIYFLPIKRLSSPLVLIKSLITVNKFYKKNLLSCKDSSVYFFSTSHDYVTALLIHKLISKNNINYMDLYGIKNNYLNDFRSTLKSYIFYLLTGINIRFFNNRVGAGYEYIISSKISKIEAETVNIELYKYRPKESCNRRKVLIYEGKGEISHLTDNYNEVLEKVILLLSSRYDVYIKPHPRLGATDFIFDLSVEVIPSEIPAELIDTSGYLFIFGFASTSIASQIHSKKYSLLDLCNFHEKNDAALLKKYLEGVTSEGFTYLSNINELKRIIYLKDMIDV